MFLPGVQGLFCQWCKPCGGLNYEEEMSFEVFQQVMRNPGAAAKFRVSQFHLVFQGQNDVIRADLVVIFTPLTLSCKQIQIKARQVFEHHLMQLKFAPISVAIFVYLSQM